MILWAILTVMMALAAVGLTIPLARGRKASAQRASTLDVLKSQLADLDVQVATGALAAEEAEGLRTEIKRRMLSEGREPEATSRPLADKRLLQLAFGVVGLVAISAVLLYALIGRPQLPGHPGSTVEAVAAIGGSNSQTGGQAGDQAGGHPGGDVTAMIAQLEGQLKDQPNNVRGWAVLAWSYFQTGHYEQAAKAYARAAELDPSNAEHLSGEGESLVRAAHDVVTDDAAQAFKKALSVDPTDPRARFFLAVRRDRQGDHKGAMDDWISILKSAPPNAPWAAQVRAFVLKAAKAQGIDVSNRLPPEPAAQAGETGPTPEQMAQGARMPEADRQQMILGMVDGLEARLKTQPHDVDGWARLMRARLVLQQPDKAQAAYRQAKSVLSAAEREQLRAAALDLGVPEN